MAHLVVENGTHRGQTFLIQEGGNVSLGRDPKIEIVVQDHLCSRRHFEVFRQGGDVVLKDLGSSNGTYVNDERVKGEVVLTHGDGILAGETQLTYLDDTGKESNRGLVGKTVGGYRILDRIGRGGMGTVYKSNQVSLNRVVALKILSHKVAMDPAFVKRFHAEAQAAGRLNHPNIVQVYDVGTDQGLHYYSMEYIENGSVQDLATREGRLSVDLALAIITDAAKGLEYAEKKGLVHRDIKPDNLMINAEGVVKIADLGLARDAGESAREQEAKRGEHHQDDEGIFGTPHFIAPEQAQGKKVDTRSDIYSLGATFYRLLSGSTPFQGESVREIIFKQINEEPTPIREQNKDVNQEVALVIERMMKKDPDERFATAAAVVEQLEQLGSESAAKDGKGKWAIIAAALIAVAAGVTYLLTRPGEQPKNNSTPTPTGLSAAEIDQNRRSKEELEREQRKTEATQTLTSIQLDDVKAVGTGRDLSTLEGLLIRYRDVATKLEEFGESKALADAKDRTTKVEVEIKDLKARTEASLAEAAGRDQAAKKKADDTMAQATAADTAEHPAEALSLLATAISSEELKASEHRGRLEAAFQDIMKRTLTRAETTKSEAASKIAKGQHDLAIAELARVVGSLSHNLGDGEALEPVRIAVKALNTELAAAKELKSQAAAADVNFDQSEGFRARTAALLPLEKSLDFAKARQTLSAAHSTLRTAPWKALIDADLASVDHAEKLLKNFAQEWKANAAKPTSLKLPSASDPSKISTFTLLGADDTGLLVKRGTADPQTLAWTEFSPTVIFDAVLKGRLQDSPENLKNLIHFFLISGTPELALGPLASLPVADAESPRLKELVERECAAQKLLMELRDLEKRAESNPSLWARILPLVERALSEFPTTRVLLPHLSGTIPLLLSPPHAPR